MNVFSKLKKKILIIIGTSLSILVGLTAQDSHEDFPEEFYLHNINGSTGFIINGVNPGDLSGYSVSGLGDINGDGIADIIIGAFGAKSSYIVFGSRQPWPAVINLGILDGTNGFIIEGSGFSVSGAGDLNGDGIDDILIGDPNTNNSIGQCYVVFGSRKRWPASMSIHDLDGNNGFIINGISSGDNCGWAVNRAGDINNDGINDILIGAPKANSGAGQSYVIFGTREQWPTIINLVNLIGPNGFTINGIKQDLNRSGTTVSAAGDINGDGIDDILIGTTNNTSYVIFGSQQSWTPDINLNDLNGDNGFVLHGAGPNLGSSASVVSSAGDFNGDGIADILIGIGDAQATKGQAFIVFGHQKWSPAVNLTNLNGTTGFAIDGINSKDYCGSSVSGAGDLNGDKLADVLISAYGANNFTGQTYVLLGSKEPWPAIFNLTDLNNTTGFIINGLDISNLSGISVSQAGDVNGDGVDDILLSNHDNNNNVGESYVIFGCCPEVPADHSLVLGLSLGLGGGSLVLTGLIIGAYFGCQNSYTEEETSLTEREPTPPTSVDAQAKLNFLNHYNNQ